MSRIKNSTKKQESRANEDRIFPSHDSRCPLCLYQFSWDDLFSVIRKEKATELDECFFHITCPECKEDLKMETCIDFCLHWNQE